MKTVTITKIPKRVVKITNPPKPSLPGGKTKKKYV